MTYLARSGAKDILVAIGSISHTGAVAVGDYMTLSLDHDELSATGSGSTTLTLGAGHYLASAVLGADATNAASDLVDFQLEVDGVLLGAKGGRQPVGKVGSDAAECVFSVPVASTSALRLKITAVGGSVTVLSNYSQLYIRKVAL